MLHISCRDFCALIIDAERSRRRLSCFCKVRSAGVHQYGAGTGCPHPEVSLSCPKADCLPERPALVQNGRIETRRTALACRGDKTTPDCV